MSDLLIVLVSIMVMMKKGRKIVRPRISFIQLLKLSCVTVAYVMVAAVADERSIFADDFQSTVTL